MKNYVMRKKLIHLPDCNRTEWRNKNGHKLHI